MLVKKWLPYFLLECKPHFFFRFFNAEEWGAAYIQVRLTYIYARKYGNITSCKYNEIHTPYSMGMNGSKKHDKEKKNDDCSTDYRCTKAEQRHLNIRMISFSITFFFSKLKEPLSSKHKISH